MADRAVGAAAADLVAAVSEAAAAGVLAAVLVVETVLAEAARVAVGRPLVRSVDHE